MAEHHFSSFALFCSIFFPSCLPWVLTLQALPNQLPACKSLLQSVFYGETDVQHLQVEEKYVYVPANLILCNLNDIP